MYIYIYIYIYIFLTLVSQRFCKLIYGKVEPLCVAYEYLHHHKYATCYIAPMHVIQVINTLLK